MEATFTIAPPRDVSINRAACWVMKKGPFFVDFMGLVPGSFIGIDHISEIGIGRRVVNQDVQAAEGGFNFFE